MHSPCTTRPTNSASSSATSSTSTATSRPAARSSPSPARQPAAGATTIACGLARELARLGKHVVLVDANLAAPAIADRIRASTPRGTLADVLAGRRRAVEVLVTVDEGIRLLAGAAQPTSAPQLDAEALARFDSELAALGRQSDVVLIDAGAGMNPWIDRLWQIAQQVLLVAHAARRSACSTPTPRSSSRSTIASTASSDSSSTRCDAGADAARSHAGFADTVQRSSATTSSRRPSAQPSPAGDAATLRALAPPARRRPRLRLPAIAGRLAARPTACPPEVLRGVRSAACAVAECNPDSSADPSAALGRASD